MSYLGIEGCHVLVTGSRGGIGQAIVQEFLAAGCRVTAHDLKPVPPEDHNTVSHLQGDISDEASISHAIRQSVLRNGPINILCANAGITNEASHPNIWELDVDTWENVYRVNVRGTFLTIKHFLLAAKAHQDSSGKELENLAIVVTGSECGKFGQAGHAEYASGKAGLQYGLVPTVKNEIVKLNSKGRINAVAPGWVNTPLIGDRLDDPRELYVESQGTVALAKIAEPNDVAKAAAFLASHRASGHMSGQVLSVDGGMEGRIIWRKEEIMGQRRKDTLLSATQAETMPRQLTRPKQTRKLKVAWSVDFDAISGWLGTGAHPDNNPADYSQGYFSGLVGVPRLLKLFKKLGLADKVTWCIPGHSIETFPEQTKAIVDSGCEIALHGYAHESAGQMTSTQERDVLVKCMGLVEELAGRKPRGYRAPLYQAKGRTIELLQQHNFLWDSSFSHFDSTPYFLPSKFPEIPPNDYSADRKAETWMHPSPKWSDLPGSNLVEIPLNWYQEDATPLQFYPHTPNSAGYVDVRVVERMWRDRVEWLRYEMKEEEEGSTKVCAVVLHPGTAGMAHVIGMVERFLVWLTDLEDVEFCRYEDIAQEYRELMAKRK
ncbi:polysaccharide deacetylase family protein [Teratosphaeria destructans]|uniref:Polysaccharide deacetylase family protein n=1 Tax=Teratosphaeria destructans TaxID=418781 RepID=A0A9W7SII1_9PEZI|nr:polysaccharide deacetylase family protein [Teratosphaeria destructans]